MAMKGYSAFPKALGTSPLDDLILYQGHSLGGVLTLCRDTVRVFNRVIFWPFDPAKNAIPRWCTGRRWHILMAVMRGNRVGGNWLMKWDELKNSHGTLIDWCTGREWPLNCMTVISAWWRLNIRFQRSSGRRMIIWFCWVRRASGSWVEDRTELETKCGRESHIRPKGPLGPDELRSGEDADKMP